MRVKAALKRPTLDGLHVLVAEDDPEMRGVIVETLLRDGAEVSEAASGLMLFDRLRRLAATDQMPHLLISDVRMPGLTGLQVLSMMRERGWSVPIILITAFGDEETHNEASRLGATAVFDKPFEVDDLRMAVLHFAKGEG
jgi:CheY-like chemotaxis protein